MLKILSNSFILLKKITPQRILILFQILIKEGFSGVSKRFNNHLVNENLSAYSKKKWKETLEQKHFPGNVNVFRAGDGSGNKKTLLMIDQTVPKFDKDAGSRTVFQYLKLFLKYNLNIIFIGDNFFYHEPYTTILLQMGIEVFFGPYYAKNWKSWIQNNGQYIDYVFLNRPHIAVKYIDEVKKYTKAKIIYYGHDLHFLREQREYEVKQDKSILKTAAKWKKTEIELMNKADISCYPSQIEVDEIIKINPSINVKAIPAYLFENNQRKERNIENTKDLMFIGGFAHKPNIDGVLWYIKEIYPLLKIKRPDIKTFIIGSNVPEEIQKLESEKIVITGFVTDSQLDDFYINCRLAIVPLRYGAGVKGKVVEAMYNQIPVVTTSIGAEGINGAEKCLFIKDDPASFAEEILKVYDDLVLLSEMSLKEAAIIDDTFTFASAMKIISKDFSL